MGKFLTLLAIILVLANARCFVSCDLDSADRSAPPCHSHGHSQTKLSQDHCIEQHELNSSATPQIVVATLPHVASAVPFSHPSVIHEAVDTSPPLLPASLNLPLRI